MAVIVPRERIELEIHYMAEGEHLLSLATSSLCLDGSDDKLIDECKRCVYYCA